MRNVPGGELSVEECPPSVEECPRTLPFSPGGFPADRAQDLPGLRISNAIEAARFDEGKVVVAGVFPRRRGSLFSARRFCLVRRSGRTAVSGTDGEPDFPHFPLSRDAADLFEQRRLGQLEFLGPRVVLDEDREHAVPDFSRGRLPVEQGADDFPPGPQQANLDRGGGETERIDEDRLQDRRQWFRAHPAPVSSSRRNLPPTICPATAQRRKKGMNQEVMWLAIRR